MQPSTTGAAWHSTAQGTTRLVPRLPAPPSPPHTRGSRQSSPLRRSQCSVSSSGTCVAQHTQHTGRSTSWRRVGRQEGTPVHSVEMQVRQIAAAGRGRGRPPEQPIRDLPLHPQTPQTQPGLLPPP